MASLIYSEAEQAIKDAIVGNTTTDAPFTAAEILRAANRAYAMVWEISGGNIVTATSATLWTSANTATGVVVGILPGVKDILHLFASSTSGSVGVSANDNELDRVEMSKVQWLRKSPLPGTYTRPQLYAITRLQPATPASATAAQVGLLQLDYWPSVTGFYLPAIYLPEFTPMDGGATDAFAVNDIEAYDIVWIAAADLAIREGRAELVPGFLMNVSETTAKALDRKMRTMLDAQQNT